ncbi:MAG: HlyC/CorC family transporter [Chloroflexi bacterium]|nr:HlyC/CorC family transporter [Chloroflexota bacterium]
MTISLLVKFTLVALLILINGFFVAVEFALVTVRQLRIRKMARAGNANARAVEVWIADPDRVIAAAQLGITLASLALGYLGEQTIAQLIEPWLHSLPRFLTTTVAASLPLVISLTLVTTLHVIIGEQVPKSITIRHPEKVALFAARPMTWFLRIFRPFVALMDILAEMVMRLLRIEPVPGHHTIYSVDELKQLVVQSQQDGILEEQERQMLHAVFDFRDVLARHVMVPRTEMIAVAEEEPANTVLDLAIDHPYTKFPVFHQDLDHIVGIVHTKDLLRAMRDKDGKMSVADLMRPALTVPETLHIDDLLAVFRKHHVHAAVLIDEFGGTSGFVTLEDVLEEIVGDIQSEFDASEPELRRLADGTIVLSGLMTIDEFNERFGVHLKDRNYDTIAGYMLGRLGRMAKQGDTIIATDGVRLTVEAMSERRIDRISVEFAGSSRHGPAQDSTTA